MARTEAGGYREKLLAGAVACLQEKGYARTTARDLVAASGTNLASIGYHFGGKDALLNEAIAGVFDQWTAYVERSLFGTELSSPREMLERAMAALVDVFEEMRPQLVLCVEGYPAALREPVLREKLAEAYARTRQAGADMIRRAAAQLGVEPPVSPEVLVSVVVAITDGLMLQWLLDPASTPDARQVVDALAALSGFIA
ncbi:MULTISPECIES: TetR/AcrR family transcriptional regulator [unclassified Nonomuraea]|uniref:TetR/AcrR family transcriptional regulator n=1 Tax=unclassified Nonomuraea TaxID=2593643 RepID=UPI00273C31A9|nr:TetR/AcrR family transcriptional regulator [Nonomuraea sp. G32]MDP4503812.1 TetR family transcriptional regulator C-terminal domain-containing protein [Nonomuraea sp. G32]